MPIARYTYCDQVTNSATSNYWHITEMDGETPKECEIATRCHAAFVDGKWIEGCAYKHLDPMTKAMIDNFLSKQGV